MFILLVLSLFVSACAPNQQPTALPSTSNEPSFKLLLTFKTDGLGGAGEIFFVGARAIELDGDKPLRVYDLKGMSWKDMATGVVVTLASAEQWAQASVEKSRKTLQAEPDEAKRAFLESFMSPKFEVVEKDGKLILSNDVYRYEFLSTEKVPESLRSRFFAYEKLNIYCKAMTTRQMPPFAGLEVSRHLEQRSLLPTKTQLTLTAAGRQSTMSMTTKLEEVTPAENERVLGILKGLDK